MSSQIYITLNPEQKMPQVGLGTMQAFTNEVRKAIREALECGYRSIDTAYLYFNEDAIGDELQDWFLKGKLKREDIFMTTKLPLIGNRAEDVPKFLTKSLKRLKLDYVDLYLVHHPFGLKYADDSNVFGKDENGNVRLDHDTDHPSLWKAMESEVEAGRTKAIGVSNFNRKQIEGILKIAKIPPAMNQIEVHGYFQHKPLVEFCQSRGIAVTAYGPLGAPWAKKGKTISPILIENPVVLEISRKYGKTSGQVLLRFLVQRGIIVIPKSVTLEKIQSNIELFDFNLSEEDMQKLYSLDRGQEGRMFHCKEAFRGCDSHKEYPFHEEF